MLIFSGKMVKEIFGVGGGVWEGVEKNAQRIRKIGVFLNKKIAFR